MKIIDFMRKYVFGGIGQHGYTARYNELNTIGSINNALALIYHLSISTGSYHNWQLKQEAFDVTDNVLKLQTRYPILKIKGFYTGTMPIKDFFIKECECCIRPKHVIPGGQCGMSCLCNDCSPLKLTQISAGAKECPGTYHINGGENNAGYWGQIVTVTLGNKVKGSGQSIHPETFACGGGCIDTCQGLFMEYYAGFPTIECLDDEIVLPQPLYTVLAWFMRSEILDVYGAGRENHAANSYKKALDLLTAFNMSDTASFPLESVNQNINKYGTTPIDYKSTSRTSARNVY